MKKIIFILLCMTVCQNSWAENYSVKYKKSTGQILAWGAIYDIKTSSGEGVLKTDKDIGSNINDYVVDNGKIREKNASEKKSDRDKISEHAADRNAKKSRVLEKLGIDQSDLEDLREIINDKDLD